ncbi:MAG: hypothetical protein M0Z95_17135 [Actinomycetota bacterium]|nr:hypothetical protein [Actinomycetota bacterium]
MIDAARTLKRHEAGLMSYFAHRVNNAGAHGEPGSAIFLAVGARPVAARPGDRRLRQRGMTAGFTGRGQHVPRRVA